MYDKIHYKLRKKKEKKIKESFLFYQINIFFKFFYLFFFFFLFWGQLWGFHFSYIIIWENILLDYENGLAAVGL